MREIKFRAFDKEEKVMIYEFELSGNGDFCLAKGFFHQDEGLDVYIKDFILMQYTGLKDKNGKEIYEGDILKIGNSNIEVIWDKNNAWFTLKSNHFHLGFQSIFYEVIGNIYEHPHLLESGDK
jgi:hypothetical protein